MAKKGFQDLEVWQLSHDFAVEIYQSFSQQKDYSFVDQIKRAVVSISNNIAEGSERSTSADFARFLDIAKGSCGEVRSMLLLAAKLDYLPQAKADQLLEISVTISKQLGGFSNYLRKPEKNTQQHQ